MENSGVIIFDGECNFCNASVNFIIARDSKMYFKFAPLQSAYAKSQFEHFNIDRLEGSSILLIENGEVFIRSNAIFRIARRLDGAWRMAYIGNLAPIAVRDYFYDLFAKNRYLIFGKVDQCMIPNAEIRQRFIT